MQELMRGDSLDTSGNNDKKKEDDSLDECLVCSDQKRDVLFTPCGHVAVRLLILIFYVKKKIKPPNLKLFRFATDVQIE